MYGFALHIESAFSKWRKSEGDTFWCLANNVKTIFIEALEFSENGVEAT
jgi:hypothetical protein